MKRSARLISSVVISAVALTPSVVMAKQSRTNADDARITLRMAGSCAADNDIFFHRGTLLVNFLSRSPFDPSFAQTVSAKGSTIHDMNWPDAFEANDLVRGVRICIADAKPRADLLIEKLAFTPVMLRGMLFRGMYLKQFREAISPTLALGEGAPWRIANDYGYTPLQQYGECVVRLNPQGSRAILVAPTASESEQAAYTQIMPLLSSCLPPKATLHFSKMMIEGLIAEGLFHLSGGKLPALAKG